MKSVFKTVWPYQQDALNLPVPDLNASLPFYESTMGFRVISRMDTPVKSVIMGRDDIRIGLAENGGDPTQDGCFFEVDRVEAALAELKANGFDRDPASAFSTEKHGETAWKVFYVIAPDGLCYCLGERLIN